MTECAMFNMTLSGGHPSTICVEISKFPQSLSFLKDMLSSEYIDEYMEDFIRDFARTDEIMPDDRTLGFVVINIPRKKMTFAFSRIDETLKKRIRDISSDFGKIGYEVELDME